MMSLQGLFRSFCGFFWNRTSRDHGISSTSYNENSWQENEIVEPSLLQVRAGVIAEPLKHNNF